MNDFDKLLADVQREARQLNIPISRHINPHVQINTRAKTRFGRCSFKGQEYQIELSSRLLDAPERSCRQTIAHELIHTCPDCMNHGNRFRYYAEKMNQKYGYHISRANSPEEMGVEDNRKDARYIVECRQCGKQILRTRRSALTDHPSRYQCTCGGSLFLKGGTEQPQQQPTAKYLLLCTVCGSRYERQKMSAVVRTPSRYRCPCGGRLQRIY